MELLRRRLHTQQLAGAAAKSPEAAVHLLVAVQAQDYPGAKWSLGQRVEGATEAMVNAAFSDGRILRTHVLRPTWHFVTPEDLRPLLALSGARLLRQSTWQHPALDLDDRLFRRVHRVLERELRDGRHRTRAEVSGLLSREGIDATGYRLGLIMLEAEFAGIVCSGAMRGKQQTYALLDERVPGGTLPGRDELLAGVTRRFFEGHGPATVRHFAWWAGLTLAEARRGVAMVERDLVREDQEGRTYWSGGSATVPRGRPGAWLLSEFDELVLGYKDWMLPGPPGVMPRPIVAGAGMVGTWRRTQGRHEIVLELCLLEPQPASFERRWTARPSAFASSMGSRSASSAGGVTARSRGVPSLGRP